MFGRSLQQQMMAFTPHDVQDYLISKQTPAVQCVMCNKADASLPLYTGLVPRAHAKMVCTACHFCNINDLVARGVYPVQSMLQLSQLTQPVLATHAANATHAAPTPATALHVQTATKPTVNNPQIQGGAPAPAPGLMPLLCCAAQQVETRLTAAPATAPATRQVASARAPPVKRKRGGEQSLPNKKQTNGAKPVGAKPVGAKPIGAKPVGAEPRGNPAFTDIQKQFLQLLHSPLVKAVCQASGAPSWSTDMAHVSALNRMWSRDDKVSFATFYKQRCFNRQVLSSFSRVAKKTADEVRVFAKAMGISAMDMRSAPGSYWTAGRCAQLARYIAICMGDPGDIARRMKLREDALLQFATSAFGCRFIKNELARVRLLVSIAN